MRTLSVLLVLAFLSSCKHGSYNPEIIKNDIVVTGDNNLNYTIIKPNPEISISMPGMDSLDLNSDGKFDIIFTKSIIPTMTKIGSGTFIHTRNNVQILLKELYNNPDTLNVKTVLNFRAYWSDENYQQYFVLYSYACYSYLHCLRDGNFGQVSGKYIGFKMDQEFGWILIDNTPDLLKIKEYTVIQNNQERPENKRLD